MNSTPGQLNNEQYQQYNEPGFSNKDNQYTDNYYPISNKLQDNKRNSNIPENSSFNNNNFSNGYIEELDDNLTPNIYNRSH